MCAGVVRNWCQVGPDRRGAGSNPAWCRIFHTVLAADVVAQADQVRRGFADAPSLGSPRRVAALCPDLPGDRRSSRCGRAGRSSVGRSVVGEAKQGRRSDENVASVTSAAVAVTGRSTRPGRQAQGWGRRTCRRSTATDGAYPEVRRPWRRRRGASRRWCSRCCEARRRPRPPVSHSSSYSASKLVLVLGFGWVLVFGFELVPRGRGLRDMVVLLARTAIASLHGTPALRCAAVARHGKRVCGRSHARPRRGYRTRTTPARADSVTVRPSYGRPIRQLEDAMVYSSDFVGLLMKQAGDKYVFGVTARHRRRPVGVTTVRARPLGLPAPRRDADHDGRLMDAGAPRPEYDTLVAIDTAIRTQGALLFGSQRPIRRRTAVHGYVAVSLATRARSRRAEATGDGQLARVGPRLDPRGAGPRHQICDPSGTASRRTAGPVPAWPGRFLTQTTPCAVRMSGGGRHRWPARGWRSPWDGAYGTSPRRRADSSSKRTACRQRCRPAVQRGGPRGPHPCSPTGRRG